MKKWLSKVLLALLSPLVAIALLEGLLRLFDVGYPTAFLREAVVDGRACWVNNSFYGYRFFDPRIARNPAPIRIAKEKPDGLIRIAVLGESAAMGDPAIEFSLARGLEKMLNPPGAPRRFEVVNAAMTAINSPVIVDIAADMARCGADIFVVYMGNNEVVGPYGPGTAITSGDWGLALTPWRVALTRLRLAGVLRGLARAADGHAEEPLAWTGMEMFKQNRIPQDDPRLAPMYRQFEGNIDRILAIAREADIRTVLCTMAVNVSDCAPYGSTNRADLSSADLREWNKRFRDARLLHQDGDLAGALAAYRSAAEIDDRHAELVYRIATVLKAQGDAAEAARLFAQARDLDVQRFRTDSRLNAILRAAASNHSEVAFADIESAFARLDDRDLFVDHVHFSMPGLQVLCGEVFQALSTWYDVPPAPGPDDLMTRMLRTPWSERKEALMMMERRKRPPFTMQWGNQEQVERLVRQIEKANTAMSTDALVRVEAAFEAERSASPDDLQLPAQWGHILCVEKDWSKAAGILRKTAAGIPGYTDLHSLAALACAMNGDVEAAAEVLLRTGPPYGYYLAEASSLLLQSLAEEKRTDDARKFAEILLQKAHRFPGREKIAKAARR